MSDRDEFDRIYAGLVADARHHPLYANNEESALYGYSEGAEHALETVRMKGYAKPRTITTWEEVDALPDGAVIRDSAGTIRERFNDPETEAALWYRSGSGGYVLSGQFTYGRLLPATVLYEPQP